mmetsp:Transcript_2974/g.7687  ORF Transcript_2974/g.7687 Transcript_2974/m.7687 type:complete len:104 (+) Transcript_2974:50-361(+)
MSSLIVWTLSNSNSTSLKALSASRVKIEVSIELRLIGTSSSRSSMLIDELHHDIVIRDRRTVRDRPKTFDVNVTVAQVNPRPPLLDGLGSGLSESLPSNDQCL